MKAKRKLHSRAGFSMAEMMIALVILGLVSIIVAGGITTVQRVYRQMTNNANAQVLLSTTVNALRSELGTAREITVGSDSEITYDSASTGSVSKIYLKDGDIMIQEYLSVESSGKAGQPRQLVSRKAETDDLRVVYEKAEYTDTGLMVITKLKVYTASNEALASLDTLQIRVVSSS